MEITQNKNNKIKDYDSRNTRFQVCSHKGEIALKSFANPGHLTKNHAHVGIC